MATSSAPRYAVIGGGFYGCALALFLRSTGAEVSIFEATNALMEQASYANQARVHTGFHYPRSLQTAAAALALHQRFCKDFAPAIVDNFQMLYAIARDGSKVGAEHFWKVFSSLGAPIRPANPTELAFFDTGAVAGVFAVNEAAFNARILRSLITERLALAGVQVHLSTRVDTIAHGQPTQPLGIFQDGQRVHEADRVFLALYDRTNTLLDASGLPTMGIKNERAEICLVTPPAGLHGKGITLMDGPFFSCMPFPSTNAYSLTHVRYTPRSSWTPPEQAHWPEEHGDVHSRFPWMVRDAARYVPMLREAVYQGSLFVTKAVLLRNEGDDGRPIALHTYGHGHNIHAVLGGKIDNIYDLFAGLKAGVPDLAHAHTDLLTCFPSPCARPSSIPHLQRIQT